MEHSAPNLFREIFHSHYPSVRRKLIAIIRDEAAAEDLAQEVFLKLYRNPPDEPAAVGGWLHRVLTRTAYDYMDRQNRDRALVEKQGNAMHIEPQAFPSNEEAAIEAEDRQQVNDWLQALPERDRKLLRLRYEGCSYAEIAEHLQIKKPQVGVMLKRASERLKKQALQAPHGIANE